MDPEIIQPGQTPSSARGRAGGSAFTDENLDLLAHVLDDWFHIPGTSIRFGIDGLIGFVPFVGDVLAGLASSIIVLAAWSRGAPYITLARMIVNLAIDVLVGMVPFVGDAFDIAWKANRRNYKLLTRHLRQPRRHVWRDYMFLLLVALLLFALFAIPMFAIVLLWLWVLGKA